MQGFKPKTARKGYAKGGMIRGPGTGTSDDIETELPEGSYVMPADSTAAIGAEQLQQMGGQPRGFAPGAKQVPVAVSNGEMAMAPEQVHAVGVQALDAMKGATNIPTQGRGFAPAGPEVREGRMFLARGGEVDPEEAERLRRQTQAYVQGAQAAAAAAQVPPPVAPPVVAPVAPAGPGRYDNTRAVVTGAAGDARDAWNAGNVPAAAGAAVRGAVTAPVVAAAETVAGAVAPVARAAQGFYNGLTGNAATTAPQVPNQTAATTIAPRATTVPTPGTAANPVDTRLANGAQVTQPEPVPMGDRVATQAQSMAQNPQAAQIAPGVFRSGNSYGDSPAAAAGFAPAGAQPSQQNMQAASNLATTSARGFSPASAPAAPQQAGVTAPIVRTSDNDWQIRNNLRNLEVSASSITNNGGRFDRTKGNNPAQAAYRAGVQADAVARGAQATGDVAAMQQNGALQREQVQQAGGIQREQIQQAGADSRSARGFQVDRERLGIDRQRAASENGARDVTTQGAQQIQQLRSVLTDPKATPEQRKQAETSLRAISGKAEEQNRYTVVPGGQEVSPQGVAFTRPSMVLDNRTGQFMQQGQGAAPPPISENPQALAIKNNAGMSREQKAEALRKMGY